MALLRNDLLSLRLCPSLDLAREAPNPQGFPPQDGRKIIVQKIGSYWILTMVTVSLSKPT